MEQISDDLLLSDKSILTFRPALACLIGVNESIVLQQIAYWVDRSEKVFDGKKWTYNTYLQWQEQFPFWHVDTIKGFIQSLEKKGLIESGNFNKSSFDRTKWYTVCHDNVKKLRQAVVSEAAIGVKDPDRSGRKKVYAIGVDHPNGERSVTPMQGGKSPRSSITKTTSKTSTENITDVFLDDEKSSDTGQPGSQAAAEQSKKSNALSEEDIDRLFASFWEEYPNKKGKTAGRKAFQKMFKNLDPEKAKVLFSQMAQGLINFATEWKIIEGLNVNRRKKIFCPPIPWGSTWINQKRWEDTYMTTEDEVIRGYI